MMLPCEADRIGAPIAERPQKCVHETYGFDGGWPLSFAGG